MLLRKYSWILKAILILIGCFVLTVISVVSYVDLDSLKEDIVKTLRQTTNLPIEINGNIAWKASIRPQIEVNDIKIPNADWAKHKELFVADKIVVKFNLISLFNSDPVIQTVKLYNVNMFIEKNAKGDTSAVFLDKTKTTSIQEETIDKYPVSRLGLGGIELYNVKVNLFGENYDLKSLGLANYFNKRDLEFSGWINPKEQNFPFIVKCSALDKTTDTYPITIAVSTGAEALIADVKLDQKTRKPKDFFVHGEIPYAESIKQWFNIKNAFKIPVVKINVKGVLEENQISFSESSVTLDDSIVKFSGLYNWKNKRITKAKININEADIYKGFPKLYGYTEWVHPDRDLNAFKDMPLYGKILKRYSGDIDFSIDKFTVYRSLTLSNLKSKINLQKSDIKIKAKTDIAGGDVDVAILAHINNDGVYDIEAAASGRDVYVGYILHEINVNSVMSGLPVHIELYLKAKGSDMSEIMQTLTGPVQVYSMAPGEAHADLVKYMYGADFLTSVKNSFENLLSKNKQQDMIPIKCATVNLKLRDGLIRTENGVSVETNIINLRLAGDLDLGEEKINLSLVTVPVKGLKLSLTSSLVNTLQIVGNLSEPDFKFNGVALAGKVASAAGIGILLAPITGGLSILGGAVAGFFAGDLLEGWLADSQPCKTAMQDGAPILSQDPEWLNEPIENLSQCFLKDWRIQNND